MDTRISLHLKSSLGPQSRKNGKQVKLKKMKSEQISQSIARPSGGPWRGVIWDYQVKCSKAMLSVHRSTGVGTRPLKVIRKGIDSYELAFKRLPTDLPKSQSLSTAVSGSSKRFWGFMSRWQIPKEWM